MVTLFDIVTSRSSALTAPEVSEKVSSPRGLPIAMTVALSVATQRMAQRNVIVRKLTAVEGLGSCTCIASDKTGTLTVNKQTVQRLFLYPDVHLRVSGEGYNDQGEVLNLDGSRFSDSLQDQLNELARTGVLCNEATLKQQQSEWVSSGDAVDIAFLALGYKVGQTPASAAQGLELLSAVPFESERKYAAQFFRRNPCIPGCCLHHGPAAAGMDSNEIDAEPGH